MPPYQIPDSSRCFGIVLCLCKAVLILWNRKETFKEVIFRHGKCQCVEYCYPMRFLAGLKI